MIEDKSTEQARPAVLLKMYELLLELALPGLSVQLKKSPRAFEAGFDYWINKSIKKVMKKQGVIPSNKATSADAKSRA